MCTVLTIAVPHKVIPMLRQHMGRARKLHELAVPAIEAKIPAEYRCGQLSSHGCSCAFYVARESAGDIAQSASEQTAATRRRYERKGWSKSKIDRAMSPSHVSAGSPEVGLDRGLAVELAAFCEQVRQAVYLHVHEKQPGARSRLPAFIERVVKASELPSRAEAFPLDALVRLVPSQKPT